MRSRSWAPVVRGTRLVRAGGDERLKGFMSFDYQSVAGDYQYRALHSGPRMQRFWHGGKLAVIDRLIRPHLTKGARTLEIGCGAGNLLLRAAVRGSFPVALDLAMPSLSFVRSRLETRLQEVDPPAGFGCVQAVSEALPLADGTFDCVLLSEVLEHLKEPYETVCEAVRVLTPGGRLFVTTPNYRSLWPFMEWAVDRLKLTPKMAGEQHISAFKPLALRQLLITVGLEIEYFGTIYGLSPFLSLVSADWAHRRLSQELTRRSPYGMILVAVARRP
jgi:2-polyprenyl-3-methyl-5-hydroxy-6-metoxy-1,4-benzoquinol methylase